MKLFEFFIVYFIGLIMSIVNVAITGVIMKTIWGYGLNELTGYDMSLDAAFLITMFIMFVAAVVRNRTNDPKYDDVEQAVIASISLGMTRILSILICWLTIWLMTLILL